MFTFFHKNILPELFWHTDVHSHVCPGIDDGSRSREESVELVRGMWELGFRSMIVTPHVTGGRFHNTPQTLFNSFQDLYDAVKTADVMMPLAYSAEYRVDDLFFDFLERGILRPLPGGKYVLIEFGWSQPPADIEGLVYRIRSDYGLIPILAHPERYYYYQQQPENYKRLHDCGLMFQINLLSLASFYDKACKQTAEWLLSKQMVDFVGSDLHYLSQVEAIHRYLCSRDYRKLESRQELILNDSAFDEI